MQPKGITAGGARSGLGGAWPSRYTRNGHNLAFKSTPDTGRDQSSHMNTPSTPTPDPSSRADSLIEYPCRFPIKVMGAKVDGFVAAMVAIAHQFDHDFDAAAIELRNSKAGNYLGITLTVHVTSRDQLDELYRTLSTHPMVRVVL